MDPGDNHCTPLSERQNAIENASSGTSAHSLLDRILRGSVHPVVPRLPYVLIDGGEPRRGLGCVQGPLGFRLPRGIFPPDRMSRGRTARQRSRCTIFPRVRADRHRDSIHRTDEATPETKAYPRIELRERRNFARKRFLLVSSPRRAKTCCRRERASWRQTAPNFIRHVRMEGK